MADTHTHSHAVAHEEHTHSHPTWKTYVVIGVILTAITGVEVAIFYIPSLKNVLIPALLVLSAAKFFIVVQFYMHLRFDSKIFGRVFWAPFFLAILVVVGMIILFKVLPGVEIG
jgi:cytochrome c oxidase subunit IV